MQPFCHFQIFSEFIILFVASTAIFFEYRRSAAKEEAKQAAIEKVDSQHCQGKVVLAARARTSVDLSFQARSVFSQWVRARVCVLSQSSLIKRDLNSKA